MYENLITHNLKPKEKDQPQVGRARTTTKKKKKMKTPNTSIKAMIIREGVDEGLNLVTEGCDRFFFDLSQNLIAHKKNTEHS